MRLSQQVGQRFHQVSCEQDEESFQALGEAVCQSVECQQTLVAVRFTPVQQLWEKDNTWVSSGSTGDPSADLAQCYLEEERPESDLRQFHHHGEQTVDDGALDRCRRLQIALNTRNSVRTVALNKGAGLHKAEMCH